MSIFWCWLVCVLVLLGQAGAKRTGSKTKRAVCGVGLFRCSNGQCIEEEWLCDTENDCGNNEDEVGCPTDCSGEHQVKCANGRCVPLEYRCDGDNDCGDTTDEQGCNTYKCSQHEIKCPNNVICFHTAFLCDGKRDCPDGWDEVRANCPSFTG
ncbi:hypothetical protein C0Q70_12930 [Pomacea canaliculata]|uniref:Uncharacterized protein n=1 Tax=Pomacea canaliculata TaxID=400727 RepID=A0A2T7P2X4_POMCA|nr:very low-density lipoprotein receptor-like [Pomacea canaliculata]PVD27758.1 hypothetical protein C0Q70_12930 [Pomacea canaliculata]